MSKICEVCEKPIPEEYQNLLCDDCYRNTETENARLKELEAMPTPPPENIVPDVPVVGTATYTENPEAPDKEQWLANIKMFERNGVLLWKPTRQMYTYIKDYCIGKCTSHPQYPKFVWKPKIVDVGCGFGVGSNVLSQEADFVWGIDKNERSIRFAKEAFTRVKNGIYYNAQVTFDQINIQEENRDLMKFDLVVAVEIIEHIADWEKFLTNIITKFDKRDKNEPTEYFISTPNRNNKSLNQDHPKNPYHVREWQSSGFISALSQYFNEIKLTNAIGAEIPESEWGTTTHTPLLAKVSSPKI